MRNPSGYQNEAWGIIKLKLEESLAQNLIIKLRPWEGIPCKSTAVICFVGHVCIFVVYILLSILPMSCRIGKNVNKLMSGHLEIFWSLGLLFGKAQASMVHRECTGPAMTAGPIIRMINLHTLLVNILHFVLKFCKSMMENCTRFVQIPHVGSWTLALLRLARCPWSPLSICFLSPTCAIKVVSQWRRKQGVQAPPPIIYLGGPIHCLTPPPQHLPLTVRKSPKLPLLFF